MTKRKQYEIIFNEDGETRRVEVKHECVECGAKRGPEWFLCDPCLSQAREEDDLDYQGPG